MLTVVNDGRDIGGNDADAEGGNSDAETVPGSRATMPESLQTPLPRHVTADSCTAAKSGKVLTPELVVVNSELDVFGNEQARGDVCHMCAQLPKSIAVYIGCGNSKSHKSLHLHTGQLLKEA